MPKELQSPRGTRTPGETIRALRLDTGLSPEQLGSQIGVSGDTIRRLERGVGPRHPHARTMFLIAEAFGEHVTAIWPPEVS